MFQPRPALCGFVRLALAAFVFATVASAQAPRNATASTAATGDKPPLTYSDYSKWESLGAPTLSPDGRWIAYTVSSVAGGSALRYRSIADDSTRIVRGASGATFTDDGKRLIYSVNPTTETAGAGRGGRGGGGGGGRGGRGDTQAAPQAAAPAGARNRVVIVELATGAATTLADVQSFDLSADQMHIALRRYPPTGRVSRGADLVVRNIAAGSDVTLGSVADFSWSPENALLALTMDVEGRTGNGVQLFDAATGTIRSLDVSDNRYSNLLWRAKSFDLLAFRTRNDSAFADTSVTVLAWRGVNRIASDPRPPTSALAFDFSNAQGFPSNMRVAPFRAPSWSEDGSAIFFGIAPRQVRVAGAGGRGGGAGAGTGGSNAATDPPGPATVEIWHAKDVRQYAQQEVQAGADRSRTYQSVWHLSTNRFTRLADEVIETVTLSPDQKVAIGSDDNPYEREGMFGRPSRDVYRIDLATGKRDKIITRTPSQARLSPSGKYVLHTAGGHWWITPVAGGTPNNLTASIKTAFMNMEDDHPVADRSPYGIAGWTDGESSLILYDRFDLWRVNIDGSPATRLTRGREDSTVYRRVALDPDERTIDPAKPMALSMFGDYSKKSGYARLTIGQPLQRLVWLDKSVAQLRKAEKADVYLYQQQSFEDSPDYFVGSAALTDAKQVTNSNAFQADYAWGKQELFTYTNKRGEKLQAMLTYPAGYKPGTKYPMVVYFYEKLSNGFHNYVPPSDRAQYNIQVFSQEGYFVLRPDITFRPRDPGISAVDCITSAIAAAVAKGVIDPARVGTMGHSWGGYESAFMATQGKGVIAAAIAGAPLTNLISMYGYTSGNSGAGETGHFEVGQERMQVPLWEDPQAYIRNSTVFAADKLDVPLLLESGDADGNVNHWQSVELYNFARRLGKQVVLLLYNGENHGLAQRNNMVDYQRRQLEWFDHYLKGNPPAKWITDGETYAERQRILQAAGASTPAAAAGAGGRGGRGGGGGGGGGN